MRGLKGVTFLLSFFVLSIYMFSLPALAEEAVELSVAEAVSLGLENHVNHTIALINYENAKIDNMLERVYGIDTPYDQKKLEQKEKQTENNYLTARNQVIQELVSDYFDLKQLQRQVTILEGNLEIAARNLEITRQKVAIGEETPQAQIRLENSYTSAVLSLQNAKLNLETELNLFLHKLGLPAGTLLSLTDEPVIVSMELTLEEALKLGEANSFSIWNSRTSMEIAKMDLENLRIQDVAALTLQKAENDFRVSELKAAENELSIRNSLTSGYYNLKDLAARLEIAKSSLALARNDFDMAKKQYEAGLRTSLDWMKAQNTILSAEKDWYDALYRYNNSRISYFMSLGLPVDLENEFTAEPSE
jgi:outer membrane protein TolC